MSGLKCNVSVSSSIHPPILPGPADGPPSSLQHVALNNYLRNSRYPPILGTVRAMLGDPPPSSCLFMVIYALNLFRDFGDIFQRFPVLLKQYPCWRVDKKLKKSQKCLTKVIMVI